MKKRQLVSVIKGPTQTKLFPTRRHKRTIAIAERTDTNTN